MSDLVVAPCSYGAAKYAVMNWHYSRRMPVSPLVRYGVWEDDESVGAVVFGRGANPNLVRPYGLDLIEGAELTRVALSVHTAPVSQVVARAIRLLMASNPGLRLLVSYADPVRGHYGGIYQAMNWTYTGLTSPATMRRDVLGVLHHPRSTAASSWGPLVTQPPRVLIADTSPVRRPGKHRYLLPLDRATSRIVRTLAQPYPKPSTRETTRRVERHCPALRSDRHSPPQEVASG